MVISEAAAGPGAQTAPKLFRGVISSPDLELPLTCGALQASRLAWLHGETYAFASGTTVHTVEAAGAGKRPRAVLEDADDDVRPSAIAEDYLVPAALAVRSARVTAHSAHRVEVQSVAAGGGRLASTDAYGRTVLSSAADARSALATLAPPDVSHGAAGWAGAAFPPAAGAPAGVAVARAGFRDALLFDGEVCVRTLRARFAPAGLLFRDAHTLVLAEGAFVSLYDVRARRSGPALSRRVCAAGALLALSAAPGGDVLLAAGADRAVHALDARGLAPRGRWGPCLKYEAAGVVAAGAGAAAVASVDNEVAVGVYGDVDVPKTNAVRTRMLSGAAALAGGNRRRCGFRADVRLVGIARAQGGAVATLSEAGALYVLRGS